MIDPAQLLKKHQQTPCPDESKCCFYRPSPQPSCCRCLQCNKSSPLSCLSICLLVIAYNVLGGFIFLALEGNMFSEETAVAASKPNLSSGISQNLGMNYELRSKTVEKLWSITEDLNILYKENWTKLAAKELMEFQRVLLKGVRGRGEGGGGEVRGHYGVEGEWTFASSFLYALTLITTIGWCGTAPGGAAGRVVSLLYALCGTPLVLRYLSAAGACVRVRVLPAPPATPTTPHYHTPFHAALNVLPSVPRRPPAPPPARALLAGLVLCGYVVAGGALFHVTERWDVVDACYFSASTLATLGLGGMRPGAHARSVSRGAEAVAVAACCVYILLGMGVVAACFDLLRERVSWWLRAVSGSRSAGVRAVSAPDALSS